MLAMITAFLLVAENPNRSIYDLAVKSAEWKGQVQPYYSADIAEGTQPSGFPRWLPGGEGTKITFRVMSKKETGVFINIHRVSPPATLLVKVNGEVSTSTRVAESALRNINSGNDGVPYGEYFKEIFTRLAPGENTVEISNSGSGWIEIDEVAFSGLGSREFRIERKPVKTLRIHEQVTWSAPNIAADWWGVGFGTYPSDFGQTLEKLEASAVDASSRIYAMKDNYGQAYNLLKVESRRNHCTVNIISEVTLYSRKLVPGSDPKPPSLSRNEHTAFTAIRNNADRMAIRKYLLAKNFTRSKDESELETAQRLLNLVKASFYYKWDPQADQSLSAFCKREWGACGDLNNFVLTALKDFGVPARQRMGRNVVGNQREFSPAGDSTYHVAAEFWVDGIGWVPIEASSGGEGPGLLQPFLGFADGNHLNKHYDFIYEGKNLRAFQGMDMGMGNMRGSWEGWAKSEMLGFSTSNK